MSTNAPEEPTRHVLSVLVEDVDAIMSRVSGLFTRRGYSMESITSAITNDPRFNRITIVVTATDAVVEQITKQLNKLINVIKVVRLDQDNSIARALMLVKISTNATTRNQVVDAANLFRARVIDVSQDSVVIESTGGLDKLEALLDVLRPFGIMEMIQCGQIALNRGTKTLSFNG
ncbi:MAG: acetolactate synthase small subunit [Corynebacterium sp.]|nr:acetolactate synthase small subunit [Corynebacterium sp.]